MDFLNDDELMAAIDIGSNSIHLAIARLDHGEIRKVASLSEKVQLAAGLDADNVLSVAAQQRGLACLTRFAGRLSSVPTSRIRIVATNALRQAVNADEFIRAAELILPKPIEVIAGREEARLIYLGVSQTIAGKGRRLVIDIGGGSTEMIIGQELEPLLTESLQMGCVSFTRRFFADGQITGKQFDKAIMAARSELMAVADSYRRTGWDDVLGSSGTVKATRQVMIHLGLVDERERITRSGLETLQKMLIKLRHVNDIDFEGLKEDRKPVLPAGLAILLAVFDVLGLEHMAYSDGALREGVMYDLLGRFRHEDIRDHSVTALMTRYSADTVQASRVAQTAQMLFLQVQAALRLTEDDSDMLRRAALLHEIGLAISHAGHHRHGAYLVEFSDVPGFSQIDQLRLSQLIGHHRRRLRADAREQLLASGGPRLVALALLLRLAVLLNHARTDDAYPPVSLHVAGPEHWRLIMLAPPSPLLLRDLEDEVQQFDYWQMQLELVSPPAQSDTD